MASTRNKNTLGNYCLQQKQYTDSGIYTVYPNSAYGYAYNTKLPGNGLLPAQIPNDKLSYNAIDIETFLYGINQTNLVNPPPCFVPELNSLGSTNIYEKSKIFLPEPLVIQKNQRPNFF